MRRCIELAMKGEGYVAPNPMVGAVIVYQDKIVGEGYHQIYGDAHAEVNAINSVIDKTILEKSTIYVSLEPCAHFGKTPPCSDLIIENKIPRVVIGSLDTFSEVNGKGVERLENNGVKVETGILQDECRKLNKRFFTFHEQSRPYVVLKWAQTHDGFIDRIRKANEKGVNWISAPETRSLVHLWRSQEMGILIGRKTAETDNPKLNVRDVEGKNPVRIIMDSELKLNHESSSLTVILNLLKSEIKQNIHYVKLPDLNIPTVMKSLFELNIQSILVEGGAKTLQKFIDCQIWDEIRVIEGETYFKKGLLAPILESQPTSKTIFGKDTIYSYQK